MSELPCFSLFQIFSAIYSLFRTSAAKTDTVYKTQKINTQTKEKTYENIKTPGNMQNTSTENL